MCAVACASPRHPLPHVKMLACGDSMTRLVCQLRTADLSAAEVDGDGFGLRLDAAAPGELHEVALDVADLVTQRNLAGALLQALQSAPVWGSTGSPWWSSSRRVGVVAVSCCLRDDRTGPGLGDQFLLEQGTG